MKILVISAHYPPDHYGGYELRIKDVADGLTKSGHSLRVLTTRKTKKHAQSLKKSGYPILRKLHNRRNARFFPKEVCFDLVDTRLLEKQIKVFRPDVIYLGHIYNLSKAILPYLAEQSIPVVVDEGGASLKGAWVEHGRWFRFTGDYRSRFEIINKIKPIVINLVCKLSKQRIKREWAWPENLYVIVNNEQNFRNIKDLGIPYKEARVIHSGIDIKRFAFHPRSQINQPVQIIYPARIEPLKGQIDAVRLVAKLKNAGIKSHLQLVGPVNSEDYYQQVKDEVSGQGIDDLVTFLPLVTQEDLVKMYHKSDFCFFPTYHKMGFSRVPLEAMACGCVVISYGYEGSREVIKHQKDGFLIHHEIYNEIFELIQKLIDSPVFFVELVENARITIEENHSLAKYIDKVEKFLMLIKLI